jgi:hypothetical protein
MLWGCVIGERMMVQRAFIERARVMHDVQLLQRKQRPEKVSSPLHKPRPSRPTAG